MLHTLYKKIQTKLFPPQKTELEKAVDQYNAEGGDKKFRFNYPLTPESVVFDVGGFEGQWASDIFSMYQPTIHVFEPVQIFADTITERFKHNPKITVHAFGLSNATETSPIAIIDNKSSIFLAGTNTETIQLVRVSNFIQEHNITHINLFKINIEGGEYPLLEDLIATDFIKKIDNIQVQFHSFIPNAFDRMNSIKENLAKTHILTYSFPFVWENWELKK